MNENRKMSGQDLQVVFATPLDAVVLAGTHTNLKRLIDGSNKAFLEIAGRVLVQHVVDALQGAGQVDQVFVVGPVAQLGQALQGLPPRVHLVPQEGKMLANCWAGIRASENLRRAAGEAGVNERPLLIISSDLPLVSPAAIDDFIRRCADAERQDAKSYGMHVGVAEERSLEAYYPRDGQPGIRRPYVHLSCGRLRLANIYVARPRQLLHSEFLQTGFSYRKAIDWRNVLKLAGSLFRQPGGWQAAWLTLRLQATLMASRGRGRWYRRLRSGNTPERIESACGTVLGGLVKIVTTPYGGLSLDVDDVEDFRVLSERHADWSRPGVASPPGGKNAAPQTTA